MQVNSISDAYFLYSMERPLNSTRDVLPWLAGAPRANVGKLVVIGVMCVYLTPATLYQVKGLGLPRYESRVLAGDDRNRSNPLWNPLRNWSVTVTVSNPTLRTVERPISFHIQHESIAGKRLKIIISLRARK